MQVALGFIPMSGFINGSMTQLFNSELWYMFLLTMRTEYSGIEYSRYWKYQLILIGVGSCAESVVSFNTEKANRLKKGTWQAILVYDIIHICVYVPEDILNNVSQTKVQLERHIIRVEFS
jgi:hypothetical protein